MSKYSAKQAPNTSCFCWAGPCQALDLWKEREIWMCSGAFLSQAPGNSSTQSLGTRVLHGSRSRDQVQKRLLCTKLGTQAGQPDLLWGRHRIFPLTRGQVTRTTATTARRREAQRGLHHWWAEHTCQDLVTVSTSQAPTQHVTEPRGSQSGQQPYIPTSPGCLSEMQNLNPLPDPTDQRLRFSKSPMWFVSTLKVEKLCHKDLSRNTDLNSDPGPAIHQLYDPGQVTWSLSFIENGDNDTTYESWHEDQIRWSTQERRAWWRQDVHFGPHSAPLQCRASVSSSSTASAVSHVSRRGSLHSHQLLTSDPEKPRIHSHPPQHLIALSQQQ